MEKQVSGEEYRQMSVSSRQAKTGQKRTVNIPVIWIAVVIVVGILCFVVGDQYGKAHATKSPTLSARRGALGGAARGLRAFGSVSSISSSSITIQNQRTGASNTYNITSSTAITDNGQNVTYSDIQTGDTVIVTKSSSTSSNLSSILVNPSFGGFGGGASSSTN